VAQVASLRPHQSGIDVFGSCLGGKAALKLCDGNKSLMDVLRHALGVAANVEIRPGLEPGPKFLGAFHHAMLNVNLVRLIARKRQVQFGQLAVALMIKEFLPIKEVAGPMLFAEDKPISAGGSLQGALLEKRAKRGDPGPGTDHDDVSGSISG